MDKMRKNEEGGAPIQIALEEFNLLCFNFLWLVCLWISVRQAQFIFESYLVYLKKSKDAQTLINRRNSNELITYSCSYMINRDPKSLGTFCVTVTIRNMFRVNPHVWSPPWHTGPQHTVGTGLPGSECSSPGVCFLFLSSGTGERAQLINNSYCL